ncbi:MAG: helix-turn-helix transcriptional regulator [Lachnospiraceae bacterium]|nr:helix-turn-helix transcriptional regulator [Lachnospiraceae bacterium]
MDNLKVLATRLKELREKTGLSQALFSDSIGIKQPTFNSYERGINKPQIDTLIKIAKKYDTSIDWLVGLSDDNGRNTFSTDTYSDVLHLIFELSSVDGIEIDTGFNKVEYAPLSDIPRVDDRHANFMMLYFDDTVINDALKDWKKMLNLLKEGLIDQEVFDLWKEKTLNKYNSYFSTANRNVCSQTDLGSIPETLEESFK